MDFENDGTKLEDIYIHYLNHSNSPDRRNPKVSYFDVKVVMPRVSFEEYEKMKGESKMGSDKGKIYGPDINPSSTYNDMQRHKQFIMVPSSSWYFRTCFLHFYK